MYSNMVVYYYFSFKIIVARGSVLYYIQLFMLLIVTGISVVRYVAQPGTRPKFWLVLIIARGLGPGTGHPPQRVDH
jgi:uncharacterized membrane protein